MPLRQDHGQRLDEERLRAGSRMTQPRRFVGRQAGDLVLEARVEVGVRSVQRDEERVEVQNLETGGEERRSMIGEPPGETRLPVAVILEEHRKSCESAGLRLGGDVGREMAVGGAVEAKCAPDQGCLYLRCGKVSVTPNRGGIRREGSDVVDHLFHALALGGSRRKVGMRAQLDASSRGGPLHGLACVGDEECGLDPKSGGDVEKVLNAVVGSPIDIRGEHIIHAVPHSSRGLQWPSLPVFSRVAIGLRAGRAER